MTPPTTDFYLSSRDLTVVPPPDHVVRLVEALLDGDKGAEAAFYEVFHPLLKAWESGDTILIVPKFPVQLEKR